MRRFKFIALTLGVLVGFHSGAAGAHGGGRVVIANRASGDLSVIDVATDTVAQTVSMPAGANPAEPMYVVVSGRRVFVGDRANDRVAVFRRRDMSEEGTVSTGAGVFHMWADPWGRQLWVVCDIDNTLTVIHPRSLDVLATVDVPPDLVAIGGKPHDVTVSSGSAYVTVVGVAGDNDYVVQYSTRTFAELHRAPVGKDPHVVQRFFNRNLFVAAQNSDVVQVLSRRDLDPVSDIAVPGAHGTWMRPDGGVMYTTNLPGGGPAGLITIDARGLTVLGATDTPHAVPHNITGTRWGRKLYVTHSGATADKVSVYSTSWGNPVPALLGDITVGLNPFGLAFIR